MIADDGVDSIDDVLFCHDAVAQERMNNICVGYVIVFHRFFRFFDHLCRSQYGIRQLQKLGSVFDDESIELLTLFFLFAASGLEGEKRWVNGYAIDDVVVSTSS